MKKSILLAAAIAGVVGSASSQTALAAGKKSSVACMGVNGCAGKGTCKTDANACKGQNTCKGKGIMMKKSEAACKKAGGTVMAMNDAKTEAPAAAPATEAAPAAAPAH